MEVGKYNAILEKSTAFGVEIIKVANKLKNKNEFTLSKQLMRSGTSIGANVVEALAGCSRADFIFKMRIALKESNEVNYWCRIIEKSAEHSEISFTKPILDSEELIKILTSIVKTSEENLIKSNMKKPSKH